MYARMIPTRHGLTDMFENTRCFTYHSRSDGWSCHQVHVRIDGHLVNHCPENFQVLMHPIQHLDFELALELFKHCSPIQSFDGVVPDCTCDAQSVTTVDERIPIVHSLTVWKICEPLDLKAKFIPLPGTTILSLAPHRGVDHMTTAPVVGSFSVWKICQVLDLPAIYDPQVIRATVFRKPHKPIPVVQSTAVFELCKELNLAVKLAPQ
ncbi:hypothetical protein TNCV_3856771 [Trichonephila clavipes]|nr:hypothetical protein TNCV_3856771 [Trichonephila clavipes]